ncbi:hypothetical protein BGZ61DRAFT_540027 [Ilyonectria robusta]|uniref:uncharacterized protein n=1 Tax=Ilyonectria robusta TaxID=1079257 RepID=UPI001E8D7713|nr:uncharacterized protein BGZ61DRAFT_540027 [Ilyonectria robusta]KAH8659689.1 hypothetical protein BGZ61DRAFT_540027 [Ilyonectria robusta]
MSASEPLSSSSELPLTWTDSSSGLMRLSRKRRISTPMTPAGPQPEQGDARVFHLKRRTRARLVRATADLRQSFLKIVKQHNVEHGLETSAGADKKKKRPAGRVPAEYKNFMALSRQLRMAEIGPRPSVSPLRFPVAQKEWNAARLLRLEDGDNGYSLWQVALRAFRHEVQRILEQDDPKRTPAQTAALVQESMQYYPDIADVY